MILISTATHLSITFFYNNRFKRIESENLDFTVDTLIRVCDKLKVRRTAAGDDQKRGEGADRRAADTCACGERERARACVTGGDTHSAVVSERLAGADSHNYYNR